MSISAIQNAVSGLFRNQSDLQYHADRISRWGTSNATGNKERIYLEEELVGVMSAQRGYEANLAVLRAEDEMIGSLIDVLA